MGARKLQLAGGSTYMISLPKEWIALHGLQAGDTLYVDAAGDGAVTVRARPAEGPPMRKKVLEVDGRSARDHLLRQLISAYVAGYGIVELRHPPEEARGYRAIAREFCRLVTGPEVIEENDGALIIQDLSDPSELSSSRSVRRMEMIVRTMFEDAARALEVGDEELARQVAARDGDVDRLYWMVAKQFRHASLIGDWDPTGAGGYLSYRLAAKLLSRAGDCAVRIAQTCTALGPRRRPDLLLAREVGVADGRVVQLLDDSVRSLTTLDLELASATIAAESELESVLDGISRRIAAKRVEDQRSWTTVVDSLGRAGSLASDIAEQTFDVAIARDPAET